MERAAHDQRIFLPRNEKTSMIRPQRIDLMSKPSIALLLKHISKVLDQKIILKREIMVAGGSVFNCTLQSDLAIA